MKRLLATVQGKQNSLLQKHFPKLHFFQSVPENSLYLNLKIHVILVILVLNVRGSSKYRIPVARINTKIS